MTVVSLSARLSVIVPVSPKIVGQGVVVVQVPPVVTIVRTSDTSVDDAVLDVADPRPP